MTSLVSLSLRVFFEYAHVFRHYWTCPHLRDFDPCIYTPYKLAEPCRPACHSLRAPTPPTPTFSHSRPQRCLYHEKNSNAPPYRVSPHLGYGRCKSPSLRTGCFGCIWSMPSFRMLRREGPAANRLEWLFRILHRKWRETKKEPSMTACSVPLSFL